MTLRRRKFWRLAVKSFEAHEDMFKPEACRRNAERFGQECFQYGLKLPWRSFGGGFSTAMTGPRHLYHPLSKCCCRL